MAAALVSCDIGIDAALIVVKIRINLHRRDEGAISVKSVLESLNRWGCASDVVVICNLIARSLPVRTGVCTISIGRSIWIAALKRQSRVLDEIGGIAGITSIAAP
jgi:hypothetical protein